METPVDANGVAITQFTLKNLVAEEEVLTIGLHMRTLNDLRTYVERRYDIPPFLQRYVCASQPYHHHDDGDKPLNEILYRTSEGTNQERLIFLLWMRPTDYVAVTGFGGMFLQTELEAKRAKYQTCPNPRYREFEVVTLKTRIELAKEAIISYERYHRLDNDMYG